MYTCNRKWLREQCDMIYSSWDIECDGLKLVIMGHYSVTDVIYGHFGQFFAFLPHYWPQKLKLGKNIKKSWRYYPFTNLYHKWRSYDVWFLRYKAQQTVFLSFWTIFLPFHPQTAQKKSKFWKNERNAQIYHHFTRPQHMRCAIAHAHLYTCLNIRDVQKKHAFLIKKASTCEADHKSKTKRSYKKIMCLFFISLVQWWKLYVFTFIT